MSKEKQVLIEEQELIISLQQAGSNERAFSVLINKYKEPLYWHIRSIVLNHEDADDVLQNVFIKVYRNISSFKGNSKLYTWLYRIATNESLTFIKKRAKRLHISDEALQNKMLDGLQSDVYFEGSDIQLKLQKAIATLPEKQRLIFNMKYFSEHTFQDMSEILDTSVGGLKSNYHIASKKIKDYLTKEN